jgi:hypothetical protein
VFVIKALSRMKTATMDRRLLLGFSAGSRNNEELLAYHLFFANDTLSFCEANSEQLLTFTIPSLMFSSYFEIED